MVFRTETRILEDRLEVFGGERRRRGQKILHRVLDLTDYIALEQSKPHDGVHHRVCRRGPNPDVVGNARGAFQTRSDPYVDVRRAPQFPGPELRMAPAVVRPPLLLNVEEEKLGIADKRVRA